MSVRILSTAALLVTFAASPALAQGKVDFSGAWKINTIPAPTRPTIVNCEASNPIAGLTCNRATVKSADMIV